MKNTCYEKAHLEILEFANYYVVFRNQEMKKDDYIQFKQEIAKNSSQEILINNSGSKYKRIPYGK